MSTILGKRAALIADHDTGFLESLKADAKAEHSPPFLAHHGALAQSILSDRSKMIAGVFVDLEMRAQDGKPGAVSVIRCAHLLRPATPIFGLYDHDFPFSSDELRRLGIQELIQKPVSYSRMLELVEPVVSFDPASAAKLSSAGCSGPGTEFAAEDAAFVPIRAREFMSGSRSFFDVHVRISSGKYLLLLRAGDAFSPARLAAYLAKGVNEFYIRKEAQLQYVGYCDLLAKSALCSENLPSGAKVAPVLNHGQEVMSFLKAYGLTESSLRYASGFVENVRGLVTELRCEKHDLLREFAENSAGLDHGVATCFIAALLARELGISSGKAIESVGLASFFHDVALSRMPPELHSEDERKMTRDGRATYRTHATTSALILKCVHGVSEGAIQAILQHHERTDGSGFPNGIGATGINRLAEVVGLSDELVRLIAAIRARGEPEITLKCESALLLRGFSAELAQAFRAVFLSAQSEAA